MSDTDHQSELNEVKAKALRILEHHGVLSALQTVLDSKYGGDDLFEEFSSPIKIVAPNTDIEAKRQYKSWTHHAYLLDGSQTIQISYYDEMSSHPDSLAARANIYVFYNNELVLNDTGSAHQPYSEWGSRPWEFSCGTLWLEVAKLDKVWMAAVKEVAGELQRVKKLEAEERNREQQQRAETEKSNFDLGDFE